METLLDVTMLTLHAVPDNYALAANITIILTVYFPNWEPYTPLAPIFQISRSKQPS